RVVVQAKGKENEPTWVSLKGARSSSQTMKLKVNLQVLILIDPPNKMNSEGEGWYRLTFLVWLLFWSAFS
ncbi:15294_t:CDS:1, partial [Acaulospora colombiana]